MLINPAVINICIWKDCNKTFTRKQDLKRHRINQHAVQYDPKLLHTPLERIQSRKDTQHRYYIKRKQHEIKTAQAELIKQRQWESKQRSNQRYKQKQLQDQLDFKSVYDRKMRSLTAIDSSDAESDIDL
jgi:hypothetical protein